MNNIYKDIELKLSYHKEKIIQSFINKGIYPNNDLVYSRLNDIELRLSIFQKTLIADGSLFNAALMNNCINSIYSDLVILYKLLYEITETEFVMLKNYINSHTRELQECADMYLRRAEIETYTTALGKSLFFKHNNFNIDQRNNVSIISLGQVDIEDGSTIACLTDINNVELNNILFKLQDADTSITCNSYNYNHDIVTLPGKKNIVTYEVTIQENQKINGILELPMQPIESIGAFITLAGKDKILYKRANENGEIIEEKPVAINSLSFDGHSYIDFYVVNGTSISFRFNKKPIATNFNLNTNKIENLDYIHHFFIECDEDFSFDFELEKGTVYAVKEKTIIDKERYYYSGSIDLKDFTIVQTMPGNKKRYNTTVEIYNANIADEDINSIMIKEIR